PWPDLPWQGARRLAPISSNPAPTRSEPNGSERSSGRSFYPGRPTALRQRGDTIRSAAGRRENHLATQSLAVQLRAKRSEMMLSELEAVALRLFEERGFDQVTIEEIASTSVRADSEMGHLA